jgi:hypothetical protein
MTRHIQMAKFTCIVLLLAVACLQVASSEVQLLEGKLLICGEHVSLCTGTLYFDNTSQLVLVEHETEKVSETPWTSCVEEVGLTRPHLSRTVFTYVAYIIYYINTYERTCENL